MILLPNPEAERARHKALQEKAARHNFIKAHCQPQRSIHSIGLSWLGRRLLRWGWKLENRYGKRPIHLAILAGKYRKA